MTTTELMQSMLAYRSQLIDELAQAKDATEQARLRVAIDSIYASVYAMIALTEEGREQLALTSPQ